MQNNGLHKLAATFFAILLVGSLGAALYGCTERAGTGDADSFMCPPEMLMGGRYQLIDSFDDGRTGNGTPVRWDTFVFEDTTTHNVYSMVISTAGYKGIGGDLSPMYGADGNVMDVDEYWDTKGLVD